MKIMRSRWMRKIINLIFIMLVGLVGFIFLPIALYFIFTILGVGHE